MDNTCHFCESSVAFPVILFLISFSFFFFFIFFSSYTHISLLLAYTDILCTVYYTVKAIFSLILYANIYYFCSLARSTHYRTFTNLYNKYSPSLTGYISYNTNHINVYYIYIVYTYIYKRACTTQVLDQCCSVVILHVG